jgi:RNA polymerase-binding transcription factor DksA
VARIPARWRWHYKALQSLRDHLVDERAADLAEAAEPIERHSMDPADSASDEFDHVLAVSLLSGEQDAIYEVESAIRRILNGTYGVCEKTGRRIPAQRLRAAPWTRFTREVQESIERTGQFHPVGLSKAQSLQDSAPASLAEAEEPEKEELQARVAGRHQLAESIKSLEEQNLTEPGSGSLRFPAKSGASANAGRRETSQKPGTRGVRRPSKRNRPR